MASFWSRYVWPSLIWALLVANTVYVGAVAFSTRPIQGVNRTHAKWLFTINLILAVIPLIWVVWSVAFRCDAPCKQRKAASNARAQEILAMQRAGAQIDEQLLARFNAL